MDPHVRIGDGERDEAVRRLQEHASKGRLPMAEFDDRVGRALEAEYAGDLIEIFRDLPGGPFAAPESASAPPPQAAYGPVREVTVRHDRPGWETPWVLAPIIVVMFVVPGTARFLMFALIAAMAWVWLVAPAIREFRNPTSSRKTFYYRDGDIRGELIALIKANRPIEAVRRHREEYGTDLVGAKKAIDQLARRELGHDQ